MLISQLISKTLREDPVEAETDSHRLLLKSGMIYQVASGIYAFLPLAYRSIRKIEQLIREEMDSTGAQELFMPTLQPEELWEQTNRRSAFGDNLFSLSDRRNRTLVLAPTHEELVTNIAKANIQSYRDLPVILYQIQNKFRDEPRPRAGLVRVREFAMKDAYSFNGDEASLDESYQSMAKAYKNIYERCALPVLMAEADSGAIGGKDSHEFIFPTDTGEDTVITCPNCQYTANAEKAISSHPDSNKPSPLPLSEVITPDIKTISSLAEYLEIESSETLKSVFYWADRELAFVIIRGDIEVNEVKLKNTLHCSDLRLASDDEIINAGLVPGYASPIGIKNIKIIADKSISTGTNFVVGGNSPDKHFRNANYPRDFQADSISDIALAQAGDLCATCNTILEATKGVEVGHIFKLGTFFSETLGALFLSQDGQQYPIMMGCYGIGVGRLLAAIIETNHDDRGIIFPASIAPYQIHVVGLNLSSEDVATTANEIYKQLWAEGIETLFDDRLDAAAGVKLNDADLLGLPIRVVVSPRNIENKMIEIKSRRDTEPHLVPMTSLISHIKSILSNRS